MKRILITAGPTNEYIDEVMKITNMSTGRLGVELSKAFTEAKCEVVMICTRSVARGGLYERYKLAENSLLTTVQIETTDQMLKALEAQKSNKFDLVIHCAAVGDYKADFSFRMEDMAKEIANKVSLDCDAEERAKQILDILTNPDCKVNDDTKISSYEPNLTVKLGLTPKIIANLREWFPNAVLVGFKLLENVTKEHIVEVAHKLCVKNNMDYIIANDLADLRNNKHVSYLVNKDGYQDFDFHTPYSIFEKTYSFIKKD